MTVTALPEEDRAMLRLAGEFWPNAAAKERAIVDRFGVSPVRFYQRLAALIDDHAALAAEPVIVGRLRRIRDRRRTSLWGAR
jgi:hypothetical protein